MGDGELSAYASMFGELTRESQNKSSSKGSRNKGVVVDESRTICPVLEAFCLKPEGVEAIEALTRISAKMKASATKHEAAMVIFRILNGS